MVTGLLVALELGPYAGKQSGETWLLWKMLDQLKPGDTHWLPIAFTALTGSSLLVRPEASIL